MNTRTRSAARSMAFRVDRVSQGGPFMSGTTIRSISDACWRLVSGRTTLITGFLTGLAALGAVADVTETHDQQCSMAIVGATIIDGSGGEPLQNGTVLIFGERILAVGKTQDIDSEACALRIDGRGQYLLPGFIDTNVHVAMPREPIDFARYYDQLDTIAIEGAQLHLKSGVTTIRDSYGVLDPLLAARDAIRSGKVIGADMYVAGNILGWGGQ